jgi:hypothetical protein
LVFAHQVTVTILETFLWEQWWRILWTSVGNTCFTTFIIICIEYIFYTDKNR